MPATTGTRPRTTPEFAPDRDHGAPADQAVAAVRREHQAGIAAATLGILVRAARDNETYVALRVTGSIPDNVLLVVLDVVSRVEQDGWYPELEMPTVRSCRASRSGRNLMDPAVAAELLADGVE